MCGGALHLMHYRVLPRHPGLSGPGRRGWGGWGETGTGSSGEKSNGRILLALALVLEEQAIDTIVGVAGWHHLLVNLFIAAA